MRYLSSEPFSVTTAGNKAYAEGYDRIFGKPVQVDGQTFHIEPTEGVLAKIADVREEIDATAGEPTDFQWTYQYDATEPPDREWLVKDSFGNVVCACPSEVDAQIIIDLGNFPFDNQSDIRQHVEKFHRVYDQPIAETPTMPDADTLRLRLKLIAEEFFELLDACSATEFMYSDFSNQDAEDVVMEGLEDSSLHRPDLVKIADALADLDYVIEGMRLVCGINGKPIADEVHRSNMSKLGEDGKPIRREDGKIQKGPNYSPPDIARELRAQGWRG